MERSRDRNPPGASTPREGGVRGTIGSPVSFYPFYSNWEGGRMSPLQPHLRGGVAGGACRPLVPRYPTHFPLIPGFHKKIEMISRA